MVAQNSAMPLWLDIKTEYIDENFESVVKYLHSGCYNPNLQDSFYATTTELLEKRISILLDELQARCIFAGYEDESKRLIYIRMLAMYLLSKGDNAPLWDRAFVGMLSLLQGLSPNYEQKLTERVLECILGQIDRQLPFSWEEVITFQPEVFAYRLCNSSKTKAHSSPIISYENKGTAIIKDKALNLAAMTANILDRKQIVTSIEVLNGRIKILSEKAEKVKKSHLDNLEKLEEFTNDFVMTQRSIALKQKKKKIYAVGDTLRVYVKGKYDNNIILRSISDDYEQLEGKLVIKKSVLFYDKTDFIKHLEIGEIIEATLTNVNTVTFSINDTFVRYIVEERADTETEVFGVIKDIKPDRTGRNKAYIWTIDGYPAQCNSPSDYKVGDYVEGKISGFGKDNYYGVINVDITGRVTDDTFDEEKSKQDCIQDFSYGQYSPEDTKENKGELHPGMLKELCRMLVSYQKSLPQPSERYRIICVAKILSEINPCDADSSYIEFLSNHLENMVYFAKGEINKIKELVPAIDFDNLPAVKRRMSITSILKAYGDQEKNEWLGEFILTTSDEYLKKLAILVQSSNQINDVISKPMQNVIKREIIKILAIDMEGDTDLEEENGVYLGIENDQNEFKTSFMFPPETAKERNQKKTIFKGVCAFLNSKTGGTIYIGVNDIGYVSGIETDIAQIEKITCSSYKGVDGFVRYITDEAKKVFSLDILTNVKVQPMYDGKVVAISVQPYPFSIVKLEDIAYIRINSESVVLSEESGRNIMANRIVANREKAYIISVLMDAMSSHKKVIIHGYSSSNSGEISDRHVEPYEFASGQTAVWCYDLDKDDNRIFKVDRMSSVEILEQEWTCSAKHKARKIDIFRMTGDIPIKVSLQLNLLAKNVLVEEYPEAESVIIPTGDDNRWLLNTDVYRMEGVGRFYIGLANCIEILNAPELEEYAKEYIRKNFHDIM